MKQAFTASASAYAALDYLHPSPALIKLIQSGKLTSVGWAVPQRTDVPNRKGETTADDLAAVFKLPGMSGLASVPVRSESEFSMALASTIYPALIAQPQALLQWFSLGRSILTLSQRFGWQAASGFLDRILLANVRKRESIMEIPNHGLAWDQLRSASTSVPGDSEAEAASGAESDSESGSKSVSESDSGDSGSSNSESESELDNSVSKPRANRA